jgi:hypothetical protein
LRILSVTPPNVEPRGSNVTFPASSSSNLKSAKSQYSSSAPIRLGSGPGGYKIDQILDLWKGVTLGGVGRGGRSGGSGGVAGRTINGVDWGVGGEFLDFAFEAGRQLD